jgi:transcriptional regulator with PAS, ATPase and Fis domain
MNKDEKELLSAFEPYPLNTVIVEAGKFLFNNPNWSVIVVDKEFRVKYMDPKTENILGLSLGESLDKDIRTIALDYSDFHLAIVEGTPASVRIKTIRGVRRLSGVYPLKRNGEIIGAIGRVSLDSAEEIEKIHKKAELLEKEIDALKQRERNEYSSAYTFENILGTSEIWQDTVSKAKRFAELDTDILIVGESGTGKELFAHSLHSYQRPHKPFVRINCPAIPFELAESQLFGYEKGAYTGASLSGKAGIFEIANDGTVFLDEISSLPLSIQAKILRVLQEREIQRLGSTKTVKVNFRFIAASNVNLEKLVDEGKFRQDLYYRVAKLILRIPPLRERVEDISVYLNHFLKTTNRSFKTEVAGYSPEAMNVLLKYQWPGNVRQLMHILEQAVVNAWGEREITFQHLPREILSSEDRVNSMFKTLNQNNKDPNQQEEERSMIISALNESKGNRRKAAMMLQMPRSTFYKKLERYGIQRDN